jgi:hypothetical protein
LTRAVLGLAIWCVFSPSLGAQQTPPPAPGGAQTPAPASGQPPATGRQGVPPGGQVQTGPGRGRPTPPQPQQKQGVEYFAGTWEFTWTGRESPLTSGPRAGTVTFTRPGNGSTLEIRSEGKSEDTGAAFKESGSAQWNEADKTMTFKEKLASGTELTGVGSWASPLSIRYESQPARVGKQTVRIRRTYLILSAQSFTVAEEMSIDGGPFQRLGNGAFSKRP